MVRQERIVSFGNAAPVRAALDFFQRDSSDPVVAELGTVRPQGRERAGYRKRAYAPAVLDVADFVGGGVDTVRAHQDVRRCKRPLLQKATRVAQPHRVAVTYQHVLLLRSVPSPTPAPPLRDRVTTERRIHQPLSAIFVSSSDSGLMVLRMALDRMNSKPQGHHSHRTNAIVATPPRPKPRPN